LSYLRPRYVLFAALLVAAPVLVGVAYCVAGALGLLGPEAGSRGSWAVLANKATWQSVGWSVWAAAASTLIALVGSIAVAALFRSYRTTDRLARALAVLPLPIPHIVAALVGLLLLAQSGLLARFGYSFGLVASPAEMPVLVYDRLGGGFILTMAAKELPFLALMALSLIGGDLRQIEESARTLGAQPRQLFRRVTLPLLLRGMLPATVAVFVFVFGSYEVAAVLGPTAPAPLPVLIAESYSGASLERRNDAYLLSLLALLVAGAAVAAHELSRWNGRARGSA
jgi:putative spermidine/putrescine transport system permease protein